METKQIVYTIKIQLRNIFFKILLEIYKSLQNAIIISIQMSQHKQENSWITVLWNLELESKVFNDFSKTTVYTVDM